MLRTDCSYRRVQQALAPRLRQPQLLQHQLRHQKLLVVPRLLWQAKTLLRLPKLMPCPAKMLPRLLRLTLLAARLLPLIARLLPVQKHPRQQYPRPRLSKVRVMRRIRLSRRTPVRPTHSPARPLLPQARLQQQLKHQKLLAVLRLL